MALFSDDQQTLMLPGLTPFMTLDLSMAKKNRIPNKFVPWIEARKKFRLSHAQIQMARELGLSPKRFGRYASNKDEPWKLPLPEFIEALYEKRFGKKCPDVVKPMESIAKEHNAKREARKAAKLQGTTESDAELLSDSKVLSGKEVPNDAELPSDLALDDDSPGLSNSQDEDESQPDSSF